VPLPSRDGHAVGALRLSAGARVVTGEPATAPLAPVLRLAQAIAEANAVLAKIALILRYYDRLLVEDPKPSYDGALPSYSTTMRGAVLEGAPPTFSQTRAAIAR
jgi:hypothetical protein